MTMLEMPHTHDLEVPGLLVPNRPRLAVPEAFRQLTVISGGERGYNETADLVTQTADGIDINQLWQDYQASLRIWNEERDPLVNLLTFRVTNPIEEVFIPSIVDFEEATEFGEPKGIRPGYTQRNMGYDFRWFDLAIRYTWMFLAKSDARQVDALNNNAIEAANRLTFNRVLRSIFNNVTRTATIDAVPVNVYPFYNADGDVPPAYKATVHSGTHNHYLTSGAVTIQSGDLDDIEEHLLHHGYSVNAGHRLVVLMNRQEAMVARTWRVATGARYDFIPSEGFGGGVVMPDGVVIARPGQSVGNGFIVFGTYGPFILVEEDWIPAGYIVAFGTGGNNNISNPVGIREDEQAALRGLRLVKGRDRDYPLTDSFYLYGFGTGIRHRGAGVVMQITAAATYTIPAAYV